MASPIMATTTTSKAVLLLLLGVALLPLSTFASRSTIHGAHHGHASHGPKHQHSPPASSPPPSTSPAPAEAPPTTTPSAAALVRSTCTSTTYPDVCVSALGADPSSATADVRGLSSIAVSAAATNASGGAATAAALANGTAAAQQQQQSADAAVQALLRTCAAKYGAARDALAAARESIAAQDYDFASVHVIAAAEYPQVCKTLFRRQRPGAYPAELAAREEVLRQLCSVASDIIALLANNTSG